MCCEYWRREADQRGSWSATWCWWRGKAAGPFSVRVLSEIWDNRVTALTNSSEMHWRELAMNKEKNAECGERWGDELMLPLSLSMPMAPARGVGVHPDACKTTHQLRPHYDVISGIRQASLQDMGGAGTSMTGPELRNGAALSASGRGSQWNGGIVMAGLSWRDCVRRRDHGDHPSEFEIGTRQTRDKAHTCSSLSTTSLRTRLDCEFECRTTEVLRRKTNAPIYERINPNLVKIGRVLAPHSVTAVAPYISRCCCFCTFIPLFLPSSPPLSCPRLAHSHRPLDVEHHGNN